MAKANEGHPTHLCQSIQKFHLCLYSFATQETGRVRVTPNAGEDSYTVFTYGQSGSFKEFKVYLSQFREAAQQAIQAFNSKGQEMLALCGIDGTQVKKLLPTELPEDDMDPLMFGPTYTVMITKDPSPDTVLGSWRIFLDAVLDKCKVTLDSMSIKNKQECCNSIMDTWCNMHMDLLQVFYTCSGVPLRMAQIAQIRVVPHLGSGDTQAEPRHIFMKNGVVYYGYLPSKRRGFSKPTTLLAFPPEISQMLFCELTVLRAIMTSCVLDHIKKDFPMPTYLFPRRVKMDHAKAAEKLGRISSSITSRISQKFMPHDLRQLTTAIYKDKLPITLALTPGSVEHGIGGTVPTIVNMGADHSNQVAQKHYGRNPSEQYKSADVVCGAWQTLILHDQVPKNLPLPIQQELAVALSPDYPVKAEMVLQGLIFHHMRTTQTLSKAALATGVPHFAKKQVSFIVHHI